MNFPYHCIGDLVQITGRVSNLHHPHSFEVGQIVRIIHIEDGYYVAQSLDGSNEDFLYDSECICAPMSEEDQPSIWEW